MARLRPRRGCAGRRAADGVGGSDPRAAGAVPVHRDTHHHRQQDRTGRHQRHQRCEKPGNPRLVYAAPRQPQACVVVAELGWALSAGTVAGPYLSYSSVDINVTYLVGPSSLLPPFGGPSYPECKQLSDSMAILGYNVRALHLQIESKCKRMSPRPPHAHESPTTLSHWLCTIYPCNFLRIKCLLWLELHHEQMHAGVASLDRRPVVNTSAAI